MPFIFQWIERLGLSNMAPPAEDFQSPPEEKSWFDVLAPRAVPSDSSTSPDPSHKATSTIPRAADQSDDFKTPAKAGKDLSTANTSLAPTPGTVFQVTRVDNLDSKTMTEMARAGLEMRMTAEKSDEFKQKANRLFGLIVRKTVPSNDEIEVLDATLQKDLDDNDARPDSLPLLFARTSRQFFGSVQIGDVPDGCTPLHICAIMNQVKIAKLLLKYKPQEQLERCTCAGQMAIHLAAYYGKSQMHSLLEPLYPKAVLDALGMSAFANAMVSPRNRNKQQFGHLFSPDDPSIMMSPQRRPLSNVVVKSLAALGADVGCISVNGKRVYNEDAEAMWAWEENDTPVFFACVCDGHADSGDVSHCVAKNLPHALAQLETTENWNERMHKACGLVDSVVKEKALGGGSTAIFSVLTPTQIVVGNVGDSRCILVQRKAKETRTADVADAMGRLSLSTDPYHVVALSADHNIEGPELERLQTNGAELEETTYSNTLGEEVTKWKFAKHGLAMSRAFGDFECKGVGLTCNPDVLVRERCEQDAFLILACDGVWDVHSNESVAKMVMEKTSKLEEINSAMLDQVAQHIASESLDSGDNISVVIVSLDRPRAAASPDRVLPSVAGSAMMSPQRS